MPPFSVIPYGASVVENTSDVNLLRKWGLNKKEYYILVCRLEPENYVREIIEGFSASKSLHPLIIVGDHAAKTSYINLLLRTANARIRFIGTVYDKKNLQVLRYHSIAYFHGHSVGGTNPSLLEALGCGNIVIAHDNIFNRETAGDIAFYFKNSQEIPAILEIVETLSIKERSKKAAIAKTIVREKYNWDDIADKYFQLLRQNE
jgi:glycosyltransferase involved in cell wall biosynthesis